MERATGMGGVFFRSRDPAQLIGWYRQHLGIGAMDQTGQGDVWW